MKKLISFILMLTMLVGMCAFASAEGELVFELTTAEAERGQTVEIVVNVTSNPGFCFATIYPTFDHNALEWVNAYIGHFSGDYTGAIDPEEEDVDPEAAFDGVSITFLRSSNTTKKTDFCTLVFKVKDDAKGGNYAIGLNIDQEDGVLAIVDDDEVSVPSAVTPGMITVNAPEDPEVPSVSAQAYGASLSLTGNIGLNFFLIPSEELLADTGAYVTLDGTQYPIKDAKTRTLGEDTLYQFSKSLAAKQMNDKVTLKVFDGEGNAVALFRYSNGEDLTAGFEYSIQDYVAKALESDDAKLKKLVQAMSDYGSLAQVQFGYDTAHCATVLGDLDSVSASTLSTYAAQVTAGTATGLKCVGTSLVLESETTLRIYFEVTEGAIGDYAFKSGSTTYTPVAKDGAYYINIASVPAKDLDRFYTVTVTKGEETVMTISTCGLSYAYTVLNGGTAAASLTNLVKGLYLYNQAANEYFG